MVEVGDLFPQVEVLQQGRATSTDLQGVIGVRQPQALRRRQVATRLGTRIRVRCWPLQTPVALAGRGRGLVGRTR